MSCWRNRGYIYIWMLFAVMLAGVMLAAAGVVWQTEARREKEQELLFVGDQFRRAIESYYNASQTVAGAGVSRYPTSLEQLLKDERSLAVKRHLRKMYLDPMTNSRDWGVVRQQDGGITGIYSISTNEPVKRANFPPDYAAFEKAENYQGWKFAHVVGAAGGQGGQMAEGQGNFPGNTMVPGLPGNGLNPFPQHPSAPGMNPSLQPPVVSPSIGNDAF